MAQGVAHHGVEVEALAMGEDHRPPVQSLTVNFGKGSFETMEQWERNEFERVKKEFEQRIKDDERRAKEWIKNRTIRPIREWTGWKKYDWPLTALFIMLIIMVFLPATGLSDRATLGFLNVISGVLGFAILWRIVRQRVIQFWASFEGKVITTVFSLIVLTVSRVIADHNIALAIDVPPSILPRAQDALTLGYAIYYWFTIGILALGAFAFVFGTKSSVSRKWAMVKILLSWVMVFGMFIPFNARMAEERFDLFENFIVWSSFIPNNQVPFHLGYSPYRGGPKVVPTFHHCPLQPKEVLVAFMKEGDRPPSMKEDAVLVAIPATPAETHGSFIFQWGRCGNQDPQK
jgi:hypothetical protein